MPVKSLMELATAACVKNIRELESVGDYLPYENVRHILLKVDNAPQLRQIELNSPQIEGETSEIWLKLIERDFPLEYKAKAYKPQNPRKWYRVWEKYKKDHDQAIADSEKKLMNALAGLKEDKEKNTSRILDRKLDRRLLPRTGRVGPKRGWGQKDTSGSTLNFARGSRTKTANGASVMRKVRREVKEIASIHGALSRPTKRSAPLAQVRAAPSAMVNDYRRAAQPVFRPTARVSEPSAAVAEYEERATFLSDSEDDGDDDELFDADDNDDYEDDQPRAQSKPAAPKASASSSSYSSGTPALKRKLVAPSSSPSKVSAASSTSGRPSASRRPGLLSNSYKPPPPSSKAKSQPTTTIVTSATAAAESAPSKTSQSSPDHTKPAQYLPRAQTSPPPMPANSNIPSSPPPAAAAATTAAPVDAQPRKRKAVNIFMQRKKRA